jgi:uncharacterized protein (TIGR02996 family)
VGSIDDWQRPPPPPPPPPHRSLTEQAPDVERRLVAEIYASPDDDVARAVYADWLIERGDPRGHFIAMQCGRAARGDPDASDEERTLLDRNWQAWIGCPAIAAVAPGIEFERGMWSACDLFDQAQLAAFVDPAFTMSPSWSTVRRIGIPEWLEPAAPDLLSGPLHRSLRTVTVATRDFVARLAQWDGPPLAIDRLVLRDLSGERPAFPAAFTGLPALEQLIVNCPAAYATKWLLAAEAAGLRSVVLRFGSGELERVKKALRRAKRTSLQRVTIEMYDAFALHAMRDPAGQLAVRRIDLPRSHISFAEGLASARTWLRDLAHHIAKDDVVVSLPELTPELVSIAAGLGLRLVVARPTEHGLRPRLATTAHERPRSPASQRSSV